MSVRPLRPATDRCLGEPLPHQLANQTRAPLQVPGSCESPALISTSSKAGCYAVLASLSGRYPPLEGRSPTCYAPVCHSTHGLLHFRVRLACVRHAASVDSEPGSNSQVKLAAPGPKPGGQLVKPNRLLNWLSDSSRLRSRLRLSSGGPFKYAKFVPPSRPYGRFGEALRG